MSFPEDSARRVDRRWAALAAVSLLAVGLVNVLQLLFWGVEPLWGLVVVLPIVFFAVLAWIAFRNRAIQEGAE